MRWPPFALLAASALLILGFDCVRLFHWRPDLISGDSLIHLVFARNFAEGRLFEYNIGESSRALTSLLWNVPLAVTGLLTGSLHHADGFLLVARLLSLGFLLAAAWLGARTAIRLDCPPWLAWGGTLMAVCHPLTFYWSVANPMETMLALLLLLTTLRLLIPQPSGFRFQVSSSRFPVSGLKFQVSSFTPQASGLWAGALSASLFLNRPEHVLIGLLALAALLVGCGSGADRLRLVCGFALSSGTAALVYLLVFWWLDMAVLPNAGSARRTMMVLGAPYQIPGLGLPFSPDAWKLTAALFPLPLAALYAFWKGVGPLRLAAAFALVTLAMGLIFFSIYFPTSWQGRYMLPFYALLLPVALAGLARLPITTKWSAPVLAVLLALYYIPSSLLIMRPLASWVAHLEQSSRPVSEWLVPDARVRAVFCIEVQGAYFHPELRFVSSDGLIGLEALDARERGLTMLQFLLEQDPDLVGIMWGPLDDPDDIQKLVHEAIRNRGEVRLPGLHLRYAGYLPGTGGVLERIPTTDY